MKIHSAIRTSRSALRNLTRLGLVLLATAAFAPWAGATAYYSQGSGAPTTLANWNTVRAGGGSAPANFTTAGNQFIIQNTHTLTTTAAWAVSGAGSQIEIESGGTLKETSTFTVSISSGATILVDGGGTFDHNINQGTIPTATWSTGSTLIISGQVAATSGPSGMGQAFYNIIWNCPSATATSQMGLGAATGFSCAGTFTVQDTGTGICRMNSTAGVTLSIANLTVTGGILQGTGTGSADMTLTISGNLSVSGGGTLDLRAATGNTIVNVSGNVSLTGGTNYTSSSSGLGFINFVGAAQNFSGGGVFSPSGSAVTWTIASGSTVTATAGATVPGVWNINAGGTLDANGQLLVLNTITGGGLVRNNGAAVILTAGNFNGTTNFGGVIQNGTGVLGLMKSGTGAWTLNGASTYTGGTTLSNGIIQLNNGGALGTGNVIVNTAGTTGRILLNGITLTNDIILTAAAAGAGSLGVLQAVDSTSPTYSGTLTVSSNAFSGGVLCGPLAAGFVLNMTGPINVTPGLATTLLVRDGYVRFSGGGNYTNMEIRLKTNSLGAVNGISTTAVLDIGGNGSTTVATAFDLNGFNQTLAGLKNAVAPANLARVTNSSPTPATLSLNAGAGNVLTYGGSIVGNLALTILSGTQTLSNSPTAGNGVFGYTGNSTIAGGTLKLAAANLTPNGTGKGNFIVNGTLDLNTFSQTINNLSGGGTVDSVAGGTPTLTVNNLTGTINTFNGLIKNTVGSLALGTIGSGTLVLPAANTYAGGTTVGVDSGPNAASVVQISHGQALGSGTIFIAPHGNLETSRLELTNNITVTNTLNISSRTAGNLAAHVRNIGGSNTLSGNLLVSAGGVEQNLESAAGTLAITGDIGGAGSSGLRTLELEGAANGIVAGSIVALAGVGIGPVTKSGAGTWTLAGTNTYSGITTVGGGTLLVRGVLGTNSVTVNTNATLAGTGMVRGATTVQSGGTLQAGSGGGNIGTLTISNSLALAGNALFNLNRTNAQNSSLIAGLAAVNYGGTLTVMNVGDALQNGDTFILFAAGSYSGSFANILLPALDPALVWNTNNLAVNGSISVALSISPSALALTSSANPSGYLDALTFTATLAPTNLTGNVAFYNGATPFSTNSLVLGSATSDGISSLARGTNTITAAYLGDLNHFGSTNSLAQVVTNHPPVAPTVNYYRFAGISTFRITIADLLTNVTDVDSDTVALTAVGTSTNGITLLNSSGFLLYQNTNNVNDQFTYTVDDANGGTTTGSVNLVVNPFGTGQNTAILVSGSTVTVGFFGIPGYGYDVQRSTNLTAWATILTTNAPANGGFELTDDFSDLGFVVPVSAYYRLEWNP
jgi:autotransporter-associated beta strand protein